MANLEVDVRPSGIESSRVYAPFDQALETLRSNGYEIISIAQNAQLRMQQGAKSKVSQSGNWVKEGVIYIPKENPRLVKTSPILQSAKEATQSHRSGKEFYLTQDQVDLALTSSIVFPSRNIEIPTDRFADEELTTYVFGGEKEAQEYGAFLRESGIKSMPVWTVSKNTLDSQSTPFARQLWFDWLGVRSGLVGGDYGLGVVVGIRGVRQVSTEGANASQNLRVESELYNPQRIGQALKEIGFSGLEAQLIKQLRK